VADQIGMDPVERDALVQKYIDENRAAYDALAPEAKESFRKFMGDQIESWIQLLDQERRKTIDHVLTIIDEVGKIERPSPYLKEVLIHFRDGKPPPSPPLDKARMLQERIR